MVKLLIIKQILPVGAIENVQRTVHVKDFTWIGINA